MNVSTSKKLTPHQREVFDRLARQATSPRFYATGEALGSHSGCFHLVHKGLVSAFETSGPRGGARYRFQLTDAGLELARKRGVVSATFEERFAAMGANLADVNGHAETTCRLQERS